MGIPTFRMSDDGRHVSWRHVCECFGEVWQSETLLPLNPASGWTVVCTDPLTVTPSILCRGCGTHGFITNGEWVPA